eukprot:m.718758 g.718758  ORF g.718758 m.718758 type:complete len:130 (-) comp22997_c1_seq21:2638-3027(-)
MNHPVEFLPMDRSMDEGFCIKTPSPGVSHCARRHSAPSLTHVQMTQSSSHHPHPVSTPNQRHPSQKHTHVPAAAGDGGTMASARRHPNLAGEITVDEDVAGSEVAVDKQLGRQVCHAVGNVETEANLLL